MHLAVRLWKAISYSRSQPPAPSRARGPLARANRHDSRGPAGCCTERLRGSQRSRSAPRASRRRPSPLGQLAASDSSGNAEHTCHSDGDACAGTGDKHRAAHDRQHGCCCHFRRRGKCHLRQCRWHANGGGRFPGRTAGSPGSRSGSGSLVGHRSTGYEHAPCTSRGPDATDLPPVSGTRQ